MNLNSAQKQAVEYNNGPLLIIAGAGTGKTTVITQKIASIVRLGLAKPEEIVGLTFTDKSANEMESRLDDLLDSGYTDINLSTFHTFCERILTKHGLDIGVPNHFKLLTETDAWLLMRENIDKFSLNYYRPLGNPNRHIHELLRHFMKCKDELISDSDYLAYAESVVLDSDKTADEERSRLTEIANAYHAYNQLLLDKNSMDFADLIFYTVKLLRERGGILQNLQKKFKYILVDEFQDVNWSQYELTRLLSGGGAQLTVVGDDDQSIYAFRGASVSNILRFKKDYPNAKEIVLNQNFRSGQKILDIAYKSIQNNNPDRLEIKLNVDKKLKSNNAAESFVKHIHTSTVEEEARGVIDEIKKLHKDGGLNSWDDVAILVRANSHAEPFVEALESADIPYEFLASSGLFRQPIILDSVNFFHAIDNYHESGAVYRLLLMPFLQMSANDLQKLFGMAKKKSISYYEALPRVKEFAMSNDGIAVCNLILRLIREGAEQSKTEKPTTVLYKFLEASGYLAYLTREESNGNRAVIRSIYHLKQFFDYINSYQQVIPCATVHQFVEHYRMILDSHDKGALEQPSDTADSVNILTVHAAKGLEFRYVFVVNLAEERFPTRSRGETIEIPLPLVKEQLPEGDSHYEEERRLFYVAMTRAKERLYFTSADDYGGARNKKISRFLAEIDFVPKKEKTKKQKIIAALANEKENKSEPHAPPYEIPKVFSYSQVKSYETCPYQYKLAHILKVPAKGHASFSFGQSMHGAMQAFYERIQELNSASQQSLFTDGDTKSIKAPALDELLAIYDAHWIQDWFDNKRQREDYYKKGKDALRTFYASQDGKWTVPEALESWFKIKIGDYLLHGRIDRIDKLTDGTLEIIDYKTGKSKEKVAGEDKEQLLIYQIAAESLSEYKAIGAPSKLTFFYLNDNIKISFIGDNKELEKLKEKLNNTIQKIHSGNFIATPSKFVCEHCDFRDICEYRQM